MKKAIITIIVLALLYVGYILLSPLFIDVKIEEKDPFINNNQEVKEVKEKVTETVTETVEEKPKKTETKKEDKVENKKEVSKKTEIKDTVSKNDTIKENKIVKEEMPKEMMEKKSSVTRKILGNFKGADKAHQGSGNVVFLSDGKKDFLRFENFKVTNGPDLVVTLNKGNGPKSEHIVISKLKGNIGAQNYDITKYNLKDYKSVSVYCEAFSQEFATASL